LQVKHQVAVFFYFMLPRTDWVGVPKLSLSPGAGNPRYATASSVVCFFAVLSCQLLQHDTVDRNAVWNLRSRI